MSILGTLYLAVGAWTVYRAFVDDSLNITAGSWPEITSNPNEPLRFGNDRGDKTSYVLCSLPIALMWPVFIIPVARCYLWLRTVQRANH